MLLPLNLGSAEVETLRASMVRRVFASCWAISVARVGAVRVTKYYYAAGQRVAMRRGGVVYYLYTDHLGSTSLTTNASGGVVAQQRYYPYGGVRWSSGTLPTDYGFTGQRLEAGLGLYDYKARYYHPALGRFISADTLVPEPGNPQDLNRYAYVRNNPLGYTDSSGHMLDPGDDYDRPPPPPPPPYDPWAANAQALWILTTWFLEIGPEEQWYGPGSPFTQILVHHVGVQRVREEWAAAGYPLRYGRTFPIEETASTPLGAYIQENAKMLRNYPGIMADEPGLPDVTRI